MQISEDNLALSQPGPFGSLGLLDLHDHVGRAENLGSGVGDDGSGLAVGLIGRADACTRVGLDDHAMACSYILTNRAGCEADTIFVNLDLLWHSDTHGGWSSLETTFLGQIQV